MTINSVDKMWSRLNSQATRDQLTISENYQIVCTPDTTLLEVYNATGIPSLDTPHPDIPAATVESLSPERVSPIMYIMTVNYKGVPAETVDPGAPTITWSDAGEVDEPIDVDFNGNPIVTANYERIEGVTMKIADQQVSIRRNFLTFNAYIANAYRHSVNSDTFLDFPPGMARLTGYSATETGNGYDVTAVITFRYPYATTAYKAWWARVLNQGYYIKRTGSIVRATDDAGEPTVKPVLLTAAGAQTTTAEWKEIQLYGYLPYNALGLV